MVNPFFPDGARVGIDANVFIYLVEAASYPALQPSVTRLFAACDAGQITPVTSALTLGELLPVPLRQQDHALVRFYRELITSPSVLEVAPVSLTVLDAAAVLRSQTRLKLPDAIHLATAFEAGCQFFVTNDQKINLPAGFPVQVVSLSAV
jgi:predicted nucleic acid-binding protein